MNNIPWNTGSTRYLWINGNVDTTGLLDALSEWEGRCGIQYVMASSVEQAQIIVVNPVEYSTVFGVSGFIGHATTITDSNGYGVKAYVTVDPNAVANSSEWTMQEAWTHEVFHPEGMVDNPGYNSIYNYVNPIDAPSQDDSYHAQQWHGANSGDDLVSLGDGYLPYSGGLGNDLIYGNKGNDVLFGNQGNDTLYGGQDNDSVHGGQGDDLIYGNLGNDTLNGGIGNNVLYGGQGDDHLSGGIMYGGLGADTFHVNSESELAWIKDFNPQQDSIVYEWLM